MFLRLETLKPKKLVGLRRAMSLAANTTPELWQSFMQQRTLLPAAPGGVRYSLQLYPPAYFTGSYIDHPFEKWAAQEVSDAAFELPSCFETLDLKGGLYAIFLHKGPASSGPATFGYIFGAWLPQSEYMLDERPHFEVLGETYKPESLDSEEEIWIPIQPRQA